MAKSSDREHFEDYRQQTQVKHDILAAYLPSYFHILKRWDKNLLYIDGFAGRGTYTKADTGEEIDGSPLKALRLISDHPDLTASVSTIFIEADEVLYKQLEKKVAAFYRKHEEIREPTCVHGTFAERVTDIIKAVEGKLAPTFLLVDPCGVSGTSFDAIRSVMEFDKCEAFVFFNIDGVRRIAGLEELSPVLVDLLGSEKRAKILCDALKKSLTPAKREQLILSHYTDALKDEIGAEYIVTFRVEHEDSQKTSHYLIHAAKHPLAFKIMKDVMWRRGHAEGQAGALEFEQASRTNFIPLFDFSDETVKSEILKALTSGPLKVSVFCDDWVCRPDDKGCETSYKRALLELEAKGKIQILGKNQQGVVSADDRPHRKGKPTLGNDYYVRIARKTKR